MILKRRFLIYLKCEICKNDFQSLDKHHITSKSKNGTNRKSNICSVCPNCHREIHIGNIILEGRFLTSECKFGETELIWRYNDEESITNTDQDCYIIGKK